MSATQISWDINRLNSAVALNMVYYVSILINLICPIHISTQWTHKTVSDVYDEKPENFKSKTNCSCPQPTCSLYSLIQTLKKHHRELSITASCFLTSWPDISLRKPHSTKFGKLQNSHFSTSSVYICLTPFKVLDKSLNVVLLGVYGLQRILRTMSSYRWIWDGLIDACF